MSAKHLDRTARFAPLGVLVAAVLLFVGFPASAAGVACPNEDIRKAQGAEVMLLPECMALEMVSPPKKGGQAAKTPSVSASGARILFRSVAALGGTPGVLSAGGDPYIATRGKSGWTTAYTSPPVEMLKGWNGSATALSYTPDFSRWFQIASTLQQYQLGIGQAFQGGLGGLFSPLSPLLEPLAGGIRQDIERSQFQGASTDHSHLVFTPGGTATPYLPDDPTIGDRNTYLAYLNSGGDPMLELLARDKAGKVWGGICGAQLGGIGPSSDNRNQGAISEDGIRIYFSTRSSQPEGGGCSEANKLRIMVREETATGPEIEELISSECSRISPPCAMSDGSDFYQGASFDGSKVFFTTNRQLADSDFDDSAVGKECSPSVAELGCDLYLYDSGLPAGERLIQVSAGGNGDATPGSGAKVLNGVTAISGDGSHVYFVAQGALTTDPNPLGDTALAGQPNLYLYEQDTKFPSGHTAFVGTLASGDPKTLWGGNGTSAVPVLGEGSVLAFQSKAPLTGDDTDGAHLDVFRYDAGAEELERISKAAPGGSDNEPVDVAERTPRGPGTDFAEEGRWISEDGETIVFATQDGLLPGDDNGFEDFYMWREGDLHRLPGELKSNLAITLSRDGSTIAFESLSALLALDGDASPDIYALRENGGYRIPPPLPVCDPDQPGSCQGPVGAPPAVPGSVSEQGSLGNPPKRKPCPKGKVRRHGRCVPKHPRRRGKHKRAHGTRRASVDRRAAK